MWLLRLIRKALLLIASGTTTVIIAACYGVEAGIDTIEVWLTVDDSAGTPIQGLEVDVQCTDDGAFERSTTSRWR